MSNTKTPLKSHVAFVLDRSGSMSSVVDATIAAFNEQLQTTQDSPNAANTKVSVVTFNHEVTEVFSEVNPSELPPLTREDYVPRGNTATYDAITYTVMRLLAVTKNSPEDAYLVVIFTDGQDNTYTWAEKSKVQAQIKRLEATGRWTFAFVGANINLNAFSAESGIRLNSMRSYAADSAGIKSMSRGLSADLNSYLVSNSRGIVPDAFPNTSGTSAA